MEYGCWIACCRGYAYCQSTATRCDFDSVLVKRAVLLEQVAEASLHSWMACTMKRVVVGAAGPTTAAVVAT